MVVLNASQLNDLEERSLESRQWLPLVTTSSNELSATQTSSFYKSVRLSYEQRSTTLVSILSFLTGVCTKIGKRASTLAREGGSIRGDYFNINQA